MKKSTKEALGGAAGAGLGGVAGLLGGYAKHGGEKAAQAMHHLPEKGKVGRHLLMFLEKNPGLAKALKIGGIGALAGGVGGAGLAHLMSDDDEEEE